MTVTLSYNDDLGRVRITANGLAAADLATVERSLDQITWTTVRGGSDLTVTAGVVDLVVNDYEFTPNVVNYYRVRGIESGAITYVGAGAGSAGNNTSLTPAFPGSLIEGDLLVTLASIRNASTGAVVPPAGWDVLAEEQNVALLGRRYTTGLTSAAVSFTGGASGDTTLAQTAAFRRADLSPVTLAALTNTSAQNVAYPGVVVDADGRLVLVAGWKQDDWTSVATLTGFTEIGEDSSTTGSDAAQVWDYLIQTAKANVDVGSFTVTGGASAVSKGLTLLLKHADYLNEQVASITPDVRGQVWLKSIARPFLNIPVQVVFGSSVAASQPAKGSVFEVEGRSLPVGYGAVRGSKRFPLLIRTESDADADKVGWILASGDILYLQGNRVAGVETCYLVVGDVSWSFHPLRVQQRTYTLPCTAVAAPGPDVVGILATWQTIINRYGSWSALLADKASWAEVLEIVATGDEVIVP